ncbi:MAG: ATP-binding protein [Methylacidiphilales bacterium]|nr:ATP-binding protein [Candidatus Methylacidiphilales bacterium]
MMCEKCNDLGVYISGDVLKYCDKCAQGKSRIIEHVKKFSSWFDEDNLPNLENFRTVVDEKNYQSLELAKKVCKAFAQRCVDKKKKMWVCLLGPPGCGKTHLALSTFGLLINKMTVVYYMKSYDLEEKIKSAIGDEKYTVESIIQTYSNVPVLILDDLGTETNTEWNRKVFHSIIDYRYERRLFTMITSNYNLSDFEPRISSRLSDRALCVEVQMPGVDYRRSMDRGSTILI